MSPPFASRLRPTSWRGLIPFGYAFVGQTSTAATNFGLIVLAAHAVGADGVGTLYVGFGAYLFLLGFKRGLITEPLIAASSTSDSDQRRHSASSAMTLTLLAGAAAAVVLGIAGALVPSELARGMLLFAPWLVPALAEDLGRSILFRDHRPGAAAYADVVWLVVMVMGAPLALSTHSDWAVSGAWGAGAIASSLVVLHKMRYRPVQLSLAYQWWKRRAWPFGRWLLVGGVLYSAASYTTVLALAAVLGSADYGGLRAVQSAFAPLTLIGPAVALPGLPMVARSLSRSVHQAFARAAQLAGAITGVTASYVIILYAFPGVLTVLFGASFAAYDNLVVPVGMAQLCAAPAFGLTLLLKARQRGRALVRLATLNAFAYLGLALGMGKAYGLQGAAWAGVVAGAISLVALAVGLRAATELPAHSGAPHVPRPRADLTPEPATARVRKDTVGGDRAE